ncbi:MAG: STAS domain-containing protein [Desulfovibrionaceae bacterium]|jgi:anti-sigma B factor antagonist|nr:STAS domain-containing protein [Desulfovibrionaceae bacterium]
METSTKNIQGVTVLSLVGRMDATTVTTFEEACRACLESGTLRVAVDMSGIAYVSSAGLRGILVMQKLAKKQQVKLVFLGLQDVVAQVFSISGFNSILSLHPSLDAALAALQ